MSAPSRPIGYWLKHLDNLLESHFEATLADLGVTRRQWQVLNMLADGGRDRAALTGALAPFWTDKGPSLDDVLDRLAAREWVLTGADDALALTEAGRAAHAEMQARVGTARATLLTGLTREQYAETVRVLRDGGHRGG
jgi:DNA-binding MarR family transcriptional regulator